MTKGTPSFGKHNKGATHMLCRRCGNRSYRKVKGYCASCGFGRTSKLRQYKWANKHNASYGNKCRNARKSNFKRRNLVKKH